MSGKGLIYNLLEMLFFFFDRQFDDNSQQPKINIIIPTFLPLYKSYFIIQNYTGNRSFLKHGISICFTFKYNHLLHF